MKIIPSIVALVGVVALLLSNVGPQPALAEESVVTGVPARPIASVTLRYGPGATYKIKAAIRVRGSSIGYFPHLLLVQSRVQVDRWLR